MIDLEAIATAIGGNIALDNGGERRLIDADGSYANIERGNLSITIRRDIWRTGDAANRLRVTGSLRQPYWDHRPHGAALPECNLSGAKSVAAIAADIERKIIAPLLPVEQAAMARHAAHVATLASLDAVCSSLARFAPRLSIRRHDASATSAPFYFTGNNDGIRASGSIRADGSIQCDSLDATSAEKLLQFLLDAAADKSDN